MEYLRTFLFRLLFSPNNVYIEFVNYLDYFSCSLCVCVHFVVESYSCNYHNRTYLV